MTILWCGGEDIDFPLGVAPLVNGAGNFRSGFGRCGLTNATAGSSARSLSFSGGAITSGWLHFQEFLSGVGANANRPFAGLGLNSAGNGGLFVGTSTSLATKCALYKWDGTTLTQLAAEAGSSLTASSGIATAIDMQISNLGASSTVNVYVNNALVIAFSGSTAITGIASLDCVAIYGTGGAYPTSEFIVADADTRSMSLLTMAPNAAGDVNNWTTGTFANINPTTINDTSVIAVNTTAQDFEANLIDMPTGSFAIQAVKVAARAEVTAGSTPTSVKLGVKTGGTINVDAGHSLTAAFTTYERLMTTNPVTAAAWLASDMNALQMDLRSA
jgi:hypothetical protein